MGESVVAVSTVSPSLRNTVAPFLLRGDEGGRPYRIWTSGNFWGVSDDVGGPELINSEWNAA